MGRNVKFGLKEPAPCSRGIDKKNKTQYYPLRVSFIFLINSLGVYVDLASYSPYTFAKIAPYRGARML